MVSTVPLGGAPDQIKWGRKEEAKGVLVSATHQAATTHHIGFIPLIVNKNETSSFNLLFINNKKKGTKYITQEITSRITF